MQDVFGDKEVQSGAPGLSQPIPMWVTFKDFTEMEDKSDMSLSSKIMQVFLLFFSSTL